VIRQAISFDICGRDKQQANHWFVVYEHGAELRISGWNSQARTSSKSKHLCGQTCLHKLVDDFMARALAPATTAGDTPETVDEKCTSPPSPPTPASRRQQPILRPRAPLCLCPCRTTTATILWRACTPPSAHHLRMPQATLWKFQNPRPASTRAAARGMETGTAARATEPQSRQPPPLHRLESPVSKARQ
jgi:hypothetical protein